MKYYIMDHRGGLEESIKTKKEITEIEFNNLMHLYKFYCYDDRINCNRYILKNMEKNYKKYKIWLLKEFNNKRENNNMFIERK